MSDTQAAMPPKMQGIVEEFRAAEGRDKLDLLLDYSASMPEVSAAVRAQEGALVPVHECATPISVHADYEGGTMQYTFDVPVAAPTVRGFAAILGLGLKGATPEQVLATPADIFFQMGMHKVLTPQRLNGSSALLGYMKRLAVHELGPDTPSGS